MLLSLLITIYFFLYSLTGQNVFSYGIIGQPQSLAPSKVTTDTEKTISNLIFRKLVEIDPKTGEVTNDLVEKYVVKGEGRVYEITLKQGQKWHDGKEITADDLLYTASINSNLREVSFDKIDDYSVRFVLPNRYSPFLSILNIPVQPAHLSDKNKDLMPVGSSNYRVVRTKYDRAKIKEIYLADTSFKAPFRLLKFVFYDDEKQLILGAKLFEIDGFLFNQEQEFEGFSNIQKVFEGRSYLLIFNTEKEELSKENRNIIISSLDFAQIIEEQEYENAARPAGPFSGTWAQASYAAELPQYNPSKTSVERPLVLIAPEVRQAKLLAAEIKSQLESNSVALIQVKYVDPDNFISEVRNSDYDMVLMAHEYGLDPDRYIFWHSSQNKTGLNFSNYSSIRTDKSLTEGREELIQEKRQEHYDIFQSVFFEEKPGVYLVHPTQYLYYSRAIINVPNADYFYPWQILGNFSSWEKTNEKIF